MLINKYYLRARLFPTVLTCVPLMVMINSIVVKYYYDSLRNVFDTLPLIANLSLSAALVFLSIQINRFLAKEIFQRIFFKDEINMPTTNYLLWTDKYYAHQTKTEIRDKIKQKYNTDLPTMNQESLNELEARKVIATAVSKVRNNLRDNKLLLQHNIEYGFFRNLLGGCVLAVIFSCIICVYGIVEKNSSFTTTGCVLLVIYSIPIIFSKLLIKRFGYYYAKILFEQFLTL